MSAYCKLKTTMNLQNSPIPKDHDVINEISITEATVRLRRDGIVHVYYNDNVILNVELQTKMADLFNSITNNKKSYFIFEAGDNVTITKDARDNAIKIEDSTPVLATAVVANNLAYRIIANFFIKVQRPKGKYRVVESVDEAVTWFKNLNA